MATLAAAAVTATTLGSVAPAYAAPGGSGGAAGGPAGVVADPAEVGTPDKTFGPVDQQRLAAAEEAGERRVSLLVAAGEGESDAALADLADLGGRVEARDESVDYLRVSVPIEAAEEVPRLGTVKAVDVDGVVELDDPRPVGRGQEDPKPQPAPDADTPRVNPYMPTQDTGAAQFARGARDGRGVTVAILDSGVDMDHPALRSTSQGQRKVVDWYNANSPTSGDGTWLRMSSTTVTGEFTTGGQTWTAPSSGGPYSFAVLNEGAQDLGQAGSDFGADLDRDGVLRENIGVLQDTTTKEVLVDLDGDRDFTDSKRMIDYKVKKDVGFFGVDDEQTAIRERMAFVVQTDRSQYGSGIPWVGIGISGSHGTHVAGIATGHSLFGGAMDGAAPGAKVMAIKACLASTSCTSSGLVDGVLYAARNGADVVNISIGGLPALNDGDNARAELYNRVIDEYDMQLVISAGNSGAGLNTVGDPSVSSNALSVASSITDDTWLSNYGAEVTAAEDLHQFSSRGPREDGGFKPQLAAPGSAISTTPPWQPGGPVAGTYALPPGYSQFNGTSMAAPQTTGAVALLIGAYKRLNDGERPSAEALRTALMSGARFMPEADAAEQGTGVVDVAAAWQLLKAGVDSETIDTRVQVNTVLADQLAEPGVGVGIHDREGVTGSYTRTYSVTRTEGRPGTHPFAISWVGNDGTFSSPSSVDLPLGQAVDVPVRITPKGRGAHSAVMRLDSPDTTGVDGQTMNVVVNPNVAGEGNGFTVRKRGTVGRNETKSLFVRVPEGATALRVDLAGGGEAAGAGQIRFSRFSPDGLPVDPAGSLSCYTPVVTPGGSCATGEPTSRTTLNPTPGVWEVVVDGRRTSDTNTARYTVEATVLGAVVSPDPDVVEQAVVGEPVARSYEITNQFAAFEGRATGGALSSAFIDRPTIADLAQTEQEIEVPTGATSLSVQIGNPSDAGSDLDLFLYFCATEDNCVLRAQSAGGTSEEAVRVANPQAGTWIAEVDGYAVPSGTTEYDYRDVVAAPGYGTLTLDDTDAQRATGETWTVTGELTAESDPGEGRSLLGEVAVVDTDGDRVGSGQVLVEEVVGAQD
ncbi:S8 family serine peptidase [Nocardioides sp. CFH 31398]|uniref:S8 family serine peptidase n=1 Tax=Nocardioides sp. CFH 31398 TaxID=2919579 RepID=UPI001F064895|nr:S8 family serine peptidase [Nocardioides sp. CFH 31398]MCH1868248.1 S8 family serine peptidase [Nocardioides sp. CFH 31398]